MGRTCRTIGATQKCIQGFSGKVWGKEIFREAEMQWKDNIEMDLEQVGCDASNWIDLVQDRE